MQCGSRVAESPSAALLSVREYPAPSGETRSCAGAIGAIRERLDGERLAMGEEDFAGLRADSPGREPKS